MPDDPAPKPVLWVSLTSGGRGETPAEELNDLEATLEDTIGDEYNIVVADDRVRLATLDDLQEMKDRLDALLPSDVADMETRAERTQRQREAIGGLDAEDVMGATDAEDAPGVEPPADHPHDRNGDDEQ